MLKKCNKCKESKLLKFFYKDKRNRDGLVGRCNVCMSKMTQTYYTQNKEQVLQRKAVANKSYRQSKAGKQSQYKYQKKKYATNINYRLSTLIGVHIRRGIKFGFTKSTRRIALTGCDSWEQLKTHLESLFQPGMTWENMGRFGWEIDHRRPISSFDLSDEQQARECFHYTNLQPLWREDNLKKSNK